MQPTEIKLNVEIDLSQKQLNLVQYAINKHAWFHATRLMQQIPMTIRLSDKEALTIFPFKDINTKQFWKLLGVKECK